MRRAKPSWRRISASKSEVKGREMSTRLKEYDCPYCPRKSSSPGGIRFHVKLTHPEKLDEFDATHFLKMVDEIKGDLE